MTSLLLAAIVQAAVLATGAEASATETYEEAHRDTVETGKPMVIMVTTDWCAPCQVMKKTVMPSVREHGLLRGVAFAIVNPDREQKLAAELTDGGPVPQLLMFRKKGDGWVRKKLIGGQDVETVEEFIKDGLAKDKAEKRVAKGKPEKKNVSFNSETAERDTSKDGKSL